MFIDNGLFTHCSHPTIKTTKNYSFPKRSSRKKKKKKKKKKRKIEVLTRECDVFTPTPFYGSLVGSGHRKKVGLARALEKERAMPSSLGDTYNVHTHGFVGSTNRKKNDALRHTYHTHMYVWLAMSHHPIERVQGSPPFDIIPLYRGALRPVLETLQGKKKLL